MRRIVFMFMLLLVLAFDSVAFAQSADLNITSPQATTTVSGTVDVIGTVNPPNLQGYFLEVAEFALDPATASWTPVTLPGSTPVVADVIAQWDTTIIPNGVYALRLTAALTNGTNQQVIVGPIRVTNTAGAVVEPGTDVEAETGPNVVPSPEIVNLLPLNVGGHMDQMDLGAAEMIGDAGMTWMKFQIRYINGDASLLDVARDRINFAHENGFKILLSIPGDLYELRAIGLETYAPLYAGFVAQVADLGADAIQVWNEQNIDREWPAEMINGESYVYLLQQAYETIKSVNEDVMVVTGAPAPTGFFGGCGQGGCDDNVYYDQMAAAGAANYTDCIGVHYNEGILPPTARGGDPRGEYPTRYLPLMIQRAEYPFSVRGTPMPLCFSEIGYLSGEGFPELPAPFAWASGTSVAEQAEWLRDAIVYASTQQDAEIDLFIIFNVDFDRFVDDDPQGGFAIIRPDGACPACDTIATLQTQPT